MLADERFEKILDLLNNHGFCSSQSLSAQLDVSDMTIRRDLSLLDKQGKIKRVHGGARILRRLDNSAQLQAQVNTPFKQAIAEAAADFVQDGETIFIDAGSTMLELAHALQARQFKQLRVVTHAVAIAAALTSDNITVVQLGGEIYRSTGAVVGQQAQRLLEASRFERCFIAAAAFNEDFGISDKHLPEIEIKRTALQHSSWTALCVDSSKWNQQSMLRIAAVRDIQCVITDSHLPQSARDYLEQRGLQTVLAEPL
jgi:DeoR/GlpR family transcriptional regulator of sugar metabolism